MILPKVHCEHKSLNPRIIATILYNISTDNYGFTHVDNKSTAYFDNSHLNLLCYDVPDLPNGYITHTITYSAEWLFLQKILNHQDDKVKSYMIDILNTYPSKLLLIIDAIISSPVNQDIKFIIASNIFANLEKPIKLYASINSKLTLFCMGFDKSCNYLVKFTRQEHIIKKLLNYFITTKMDTKVNIMCTSESFTACILFNHHTKVDFTILTYDHNSDIVSMCVFDKLPNVDRFIDCVIGLPFKRDNLYNCTMIFHSDDNMFKLSKEKTKSLTNRIIKSLESIKTHSWYLGNNDLFY